MFTKNVILLTFFFVEFSHSQHIFDVASQSCQDGRRLDKIEEKLQKYEKRISELEKEIKNIKKPKKSTEPLATWGKEFFLVFPPLFVDSDDSHCMIYVVAMETGKCDVRIPLRNETYELFLKSGKNELILPKNLMSNHNEIEDKGIYISSNIYVTVYALKHDKYTSTAFLVLPTKMTSNNYYMSVPSIRPNPVSPSHMDLYNNTIAIVSSADFNLVRITLNITETDSFHLLGKKYKRGETIYQVMQKYESLVISHDKDLSGSTILAIDPVSVATGNQCGRLHNDTACSGMNLMLPNGIDLASKSEFVFVSPFFENFIHGYNIRITTLRSEPTRIQYRLGKSAELQNLFSLQRGHYDINVANNAPVYVRSSGPIVVTAITPGKNNTDNIGTAFMLLVLEYAQYANEYHFVVPDVKLTSHASVVARRISSIRLNGQPLTGEISYVEVDNGDRFEIVAFPIVAGYHVAHDVEGNPFAVYVYGKQKPSLGYGYTVGFNLP